MTAFEITWEAPEFEYREKGVSWYWVSIIVAALIVAFSVWIKNFLFGFFVVVAEMLFIVWGNRAPRTLAFTARESGIDIQNEKSLFFKDFENMSVDPLGDGFAELVLYPRAKFKTAFKMLVPENKLVELRDRLKPIIKEIPFEPTLIDAIEKLTRF